MPAQLRFGLTDHVRAAISKDAGLTKDNAWKVLDWTKPEPYERYSTFDFQHIRWEFLRRTPQYRIAWVRTALKLDLFVPLDWEREFSLSYRADPRSSKPPTFTDTDFMVSPYLGKDGPGAPVVDFVEVAHGRGYVLAMINPALPLSELQTLIGREFREWARDNGYDTKSIKLNSQYYAQHLRLIDARSTGMTFASLSMHPSYEDFMYTDNIIGKKWKDAQRASWKICGVPRPSLEDLREMRSLTGYLSGIT